MSEENVEVVLSRHSLIKLCEASEHVLYEIEMLYGTYRDLDLLEKERHADHEVSRATANALLESWTVHVRNLTAFFRPHKPTALDVLAEHYVDGWSDLLPPTTADLRAHADRISKEIAHLSYARTTVSQERGARAGGAGAFRLDMMDVGDYRGHAGFARWLEDWGQAWSQYSMEPEEFLDAGERVVACILQKTTGHGSGVALERHDAMVFEIRDAKIVRVDYHNNRSQAVKHAGCRSRRVAGELTASAGRDPRRMKSEAAKRPWRDGLNRRSRPSVSAADPCAR